MNKNLFLRLSALAVLIVFATACSQKAEYTNAIPADATAVAAINLKSLAEKAGINDKVNKDAFTKLTDALKSGMSAASYQQLEAVINDPRKSGLDVTEPIYLFGTLSSPIVNLVVKVNDEATLKAFLEAMQKETGSTPLTEADGYSYTNIAGQALLAFTPSTLLAVSYNGTSQLEKAKEIVATLLKQTEETSISNSPAFKKLQKMNGDIQILASPTDFLKEYTKMFNYAIPQQEEMKDLKILASLSFEKGRIEMQVENFTENVELKKLLEKQYKGTCPIENTFLKYFPQSTIALFSLGAKGEELYSTLQENEQFRKEFSMAQSEELKNLFGMFQNDLTAGLINVTMNSAPTFLAYASVNSGAPLKALYEKKADLNFRSSQNIVKLNEDEYVYKSREINVFFGVRNKQLYATNDELLYKNLFETVSPSIKDANYASEMKDNQLVFIVNAEAILALPLTKILIEFGGTKVSTYYSLAQQLSYIALTAKDEKSIAVLQLKNKDVNALKQIADFVKGLAGM